MEMPRIEEVNGQKILYVGDKPFVMLSGEVHNSSASDVAYMEAIWEKAKGLQLNSLLLPVSWEMIEPEEGVFDFHVADKLILQARKYEMKIGFLWFGSWKNAACYYAPGWVKKDLRRFKRAQVIKGLNYSRLPEFHGFPYTTISAFCEEAQRADAKAFAALMGHLKEFDGTEQTVVMVQVENETGLLGAAREHSEEADERYKQGIPQTLAKKLKVDAGTAWETVYGENADESFTAYYTAAFVNEVAKAGKAVYPLPMAVNCWLDKGQKPGRYPSGGLWQSLGISGSLPHRK